MSFQIHFDIPIYVLLLLASLSAGLSYLMYRGLEGISRPRRVFLGVLRGASFFFLFLAALNLVTDFIRFESKKRDVFLLLDDSRSMSLTDGSSPRPQVVSEILKSGSLESLRKYFDVKSVLFGAEVAARRGLDSLHYDQPSTNIESALVYASNAVSEERTAFALLISDGDYNSGGNPVDAARAMTFPIYTVGVGDSTQPSDVVVKQVIPAPSMYVGKRTVVKAIVGSNGFGGTKLNIHLLEDGREFDTRSVTLPQQGDLEVSFSYTPSTPGTHLLKVYVPPLQGEFNRRNNSATATAEVKKGKYNVLLIAGEPSSDVAFLRRDIDGSEDFDLSVLVQKTGDSFNEKGTGRILAGKYDAVILYDFPNEQSSATLRDVKNMLGSTGVPYLYLAGNRVSASRLTGFPRFPLVITNLQPEEFHVGISLASPDKIPIALQPVYTLLNANSSLFPPLYYRRIQCRPSAGASTLAFPVISGARIDLPLLIVDPPGRSAAFMAYGLWRLQLMSSLSGLQSDFLRNFLTTFLRTLISGGKQKLLTVQTGRNVYDPSEAVSFSALLVGENGSPVNDANVDVNVVNEASGRNVSDVRLSSTGDGGYSGQVAGLGEGKYVFHARALSGTTFLGADSGTVVVEPLNTEFIQTSMNAPLMRQLAAVSGGKFLTPLEFERHGIDLKSEWKKPVEISLGKRFELLSALPFLALVLLLLSVEWVVRKIWGLP